MAKLNWRRFENTRARIRHDWARSSGSASGPIIGTATCRVVEIGRQAYVSNASAGLEHRGDKTI